MEIGMKALSAFGPYNLLVTSMAFVIGFLMYFYTPYWKVRKIPGPPTTFLVGHLPLLAKHGPDVLRVFAKNHGPIFRFHIGRQPLVIVADPELCREVGIKKFKYINNRIVRVSTSGSPLHEQGLFLSRDSRWSSMRNAIVSLYQPTRLSTLIPTMQSYIDSLLFNISTAKEGEDILFSDLSLRTAMDIFGETAFGVQFGLIKQASNHNEVEDNHGNHTSNHDNDDEVSQFLEQHRHSIESLKMDLSSSLSTILGLIAPVLQNPCREILKRIPGTADYKMYTTTQKLCERIDAIIAKRSSEKTTASNDFLAAILNARESGVGKDLFTDDYVRALTYEHLLGGSKTTAFTLTTAIYLVSKHPNVEKKLLQEIDSFIPHDVNPTADDLQCKFPYLDQVVKETMRYYTVSPLVARETSQQVEIGGYVLPKGTWVWLGIGVLAKDPMQFPEPDVFRPERFDPSCEEEKRRHPYAHIPFGIGPRACIGQKFAIQQLKLALIRLYRNYIFIHSPKMESPIEFEYGLVIDFKHDVKFQAIKRKI